MYIFKLNPRPDNNLSGNWLLDRIWDYSPQSRSLCSRPGHSLVEKSCFYILMISFCQLSCNPLNQGLNLSTVVQLGAVQLKCNFCFDSGPVICPTGWQKVYRVPENTRTPKYGLSDNFYTEYSGRRVFSCWLFLNYSKKWALFDRTIQKFKNQGNHSSTIFFYCISQGYDTELINVMVRNVLAHQ